MLDYVLAGLGPPVFTALIATSLIGSFIAVSVGIGGGVLVLTVMASILPPTALIPVHGGIQFGSNIFRAALLARHTHWRPVVGFCIGSAIGAVAGGQLVINLNPAVVQIAIGAFVIYSVVSNPPAWLTRFPVVTGGISSFLTMFFGATGVFVANFVKLLNLSRQSHVAMHATFMTAQHFLKTVVFGVLGFEFYPWIGFIAAMIVAGFLGTILGRMVLIKLRDDRFKRALDIVLVFLAIRLIWMGLVQISG